MTSLSTVEDDNIVDCYPENLKNVKSTEFSRLKGFVYLDHAGSTLYSKSQIDQYARDLQNNVYGNPHSTSSSSDFISDIIYQVRCSVLSHFNVTLDDYDVVFVSGSTGALKLLAESFAWTSGTSKFVYLEDNHTSVVGIRELAACHEASSICLCTPLPYSATGSLKMFDLSFYKPVVVNDKCANPNKRGNHLFAFPAQSNFSGCKYPLKWINEVTECGLLDSDSPDDWSVLLDAAGFVSTSPLNLQKCSPDFVCLSFYKMFGFPTGLGALLVKQDSVDKLSEKKYFGGGTVDGYLASEDFFKPRQTLHDRLEDGTIPFLDILALKHGFDSMNRIIHHSLLKVQKHTFILAKRLYDGLRDLEYNNGASVIQVYSFSNYTDCEIQGPIVTFNVKRSNGSFVGFNHVLHLASSRNIQLRAGCFCNVGACVSMLNMDSSTLKQAYKEGHSCGGSIDLIDGFPVGAIRASIGYMTTVEDIDALIRFFKDCFILADITNSEVFYDSLSYVPHDNEVYLKEIFLYPVKSCRAMKVSEWTICETGLKYDRAWMVVNEHGVCLTLKRERKLTSIQPFINLNESTLSLSADGFGTVTIPIQGCDANSVNKTCQTKVCGDRILGTDCGVEVGRWLTEVLGQTASLVQKRTDARRFGKPKVKSQHGQEYNAHKDSNELHDNPPTLSLANEAQYLLLSLSTVECLRQVMMDLTESQNHLRGEDVTSNQAALDTSSVVGRFRCNFLLAGTKAFTEESWSDVFIENSSSAEASEEKFICFHCVGVCNRCSIIGIDQVTGARSIEPLRSLGTLPTTLSEDREGKNCSQRRNNFGIYLSTKSSNFVIKVGASVTVKNVLTV